MRRCLIALMVLPMVACQQQDASKQRNDFADAFEMASAALEEVRSGTRHVVKGELTAEMRGELERSKEDVSPVVAPMGKPIDEYRLEKLTAAANNLRPFANTGPADQKVAVNRLLAAASFSEARHILGQAGDAWTRQEPAATRLSDLTVRLLVARQALEAQSLVKFDELMSQLQASEQRLVEAVDGLTARVRDVNSLIQRAEQVITLLESQRQQKTEASAEVSTRAFQARGEAGYDLTVQAANLSREADQLSVQAESERIDLDIERARHALLQAELSHTQSQLDRTRQSIQALRDRAGQSVSLTNDANTHATQVEQQFDEVAGGIIEAKTSEIDPLLDRLAALAGKAAAELEAARAAADSAGAASRDAGDGGREAARLAAASGRSNAAHILRSAASVHRQYALLLGLTAARVEAAYPQKGAQLNEVATAATAKADEADAASRTHYEAAVEALTTLSEGDSPVNRAALIQLIQAHTALADSDSDAGRTQEAQSRRDEIIAPLQQRLLTPAESTQ